MIDCRSDHQESNDDSGYFWDGQTSCLFRTQLISIQFGSNGSGSGDCGTNHAHTISLFIIQFVHITGKVFLLKEEIGPRKVVIDAAN